MWTYGNRRTQKIYESKVIQNKLIKISAIVVVIAIVIFAGAFLWANFLHGNFGISKDRPDSVIEKSGVIKKKANLETGSLDIRKNESSEFSVNQAPTISLKTIEGITNQEIFYPDTSKEPTLTLFWGEKKETTIPSSEVLSIAQFGAWESGGAPTPFKIGFEPNSEIGVDLKPGRYPLYAFTKGIITNIDRKISGEITIRYGKKYALKHMHIADLSPTLKVGQKIEAGTFIGLTPIIQSGPNDPRGASFSFFEIELDKIIDSRAARAVNPFDYFDAASKAGLEQARLADKVSIKSDWIGTVTDKNKSWIPYVGKPETWADMHKIGFNGDLESFEEFAKANNLEWVLSK